MRVVITVVMIVLLLGLWAAERYFLFGRGRQTTVGNPDHPWNHPLGRGARRVFGVIAIVGGGILLGFDASGMTHSPGGIPLDIVLIVAGLLLALGVLPLRRHADR